jgi:hypothetical protein
MLRAPSLHNLDNRTATVFAAGSRPFDRFVRIVEDLVATGDRWVPNKPDLLSATVEQVELVGRPPYRRAIVTACEVTNRKRVTPAENSPSGRPIEVAGTGELLVTRFEQPVRQTVNGWLIYAQPRQATQFDQGETTCPPE